MALTTTMAKLRAVLFGATGLAGQQFVSALKAHPFFELAAVAASPRNAGRRYGEALAEGGWFLAEPIPEAVASLPLLEAAKVEASDFELAFSAVEADVARELEPRLARLIPVFSTASAFRYDADVPLLLPPVNASHLPLVRVQRARGFAGYVAPIPNCTATGLVVALAPLVERFGVQAVLMTSLQAVSGAGRSPGVAALDVLDNVIPFIPKEEGKVEAEARKILGRWASGQPSVDAHPMRLSATCTRVAVLGGTPRRCPSRWDGRQASRKCAPRCATGGARPRRATCLPARLGGLRCWMPSTGRSRGSTARRTAGWRPASAGCARTPSCPTA